MSTGTQRRLAQKTQVKDMGWTPWKPHMLDRKSKKPWKANEWNHIWGIFGSREGEGHVVVAQGAHTNFLPPRVHEGIKGITLDVGITSHCFSHVYSVVANDVCVKCTRKTVLGVHITKTWFHCTLYQYSVENLKELDKIRNIGKYVSKTIGCDSRSRLEAAGGKNGEIDVAETLNKNGND